ncbi:hypothetical protein QO259_00960 [Salinicola sp. JS01]|uniref:hypothetical protein n=1 Tax=Salinicola sp. JS01 TaxID=3050071 RepID=UPI00255B5A5F|nr:hypothetical protein [Salinicola sp. JS01]WIX33260.1 hypothetical protein QO259_00960 [Salinicola sp. JS01]
MLLPSWVPENEGADWQSLNDLNEVHNMLAERAKQWPEQWKQEGRLETARNMLVRTSMDDQMISELTGVDVERVRKLREELKH